TASTASTASLVLRSRPECAAGHIAFLGPPEVMQQHGELASHRDDRALLGGFAATRGEREAPAAQIRVRPKRTEDVLCAADQQAPQRHVARFGDMTLRIAGPRRAPSG